MSTNGGNKNLMRSFPQKTLTAGGLDNLLGRMDLTGEVTWKKGNGRKKKQWTKANIVVVRELILSQESQPGMHYSKRKIFYLTYILKCSVHLQGYYKIKGQKLGKIDKQNRVIRCKKMLRCLTKASLKRIFFSFSSFKLNSTRKAIKSMQKMGKRNKFRMRDCT